MGESTYVIIEENGKICVNRLLKPMILQDHMSIDEWNKLCDQIDEILIPANRFKCCRRNYLVIMNVNLTILAVFLILVEIFFVQCYEHETLDYCGEYNFFEGRRVHIIALFHFFATLVVFLFFFSYNTYWNRTFGKTLKDGFTKLCTRMNGEKKQPSVLHFNVKDISPSKRNSDYSCCLRRYCCFGNRLYIVNSCIEITLYSAMGYGDTDDL